MALSRTDHGAYESTTNWGTAAFTTPSFTPADNSVLIVTVASTIVFGGGAKDIGQNTITDSAGLSWTFIGRANLTADAPIGTCMFRAEVVTGVSMTITVDDDDNDDIGSWLVDVISYTGYAVGSPVVGFVGSGTTDIGDGGHTLTFPLQPTLDDETLVVLHLDVSGTVANPNYGLYTEIFESNAGSDFGVLCLASRTAAIATTAVMTDVYTGGGTFFKALMLAVIVKAEVPPPLATAVVAWITA